MAKVTRKTREQFRAMSDATPRSQKEETLRRFWQSGAPPLLRFGHDADASKMSDRDLDDILYGIHLIITSPAFAT